MINVEPRISFQHKNVRGLINYAKKLTVDLEEQKQKVVMSEQIVNDLKKAGSDDMGSLMDMIHMLKEKELSFGEEIDKLQQLSIIKDDEITNLDVELRSLNDFMNIVESQQREKITLFKSEIERNGKVIKRTDKLIVDMQ